MNPEQLSDAMNELPQELLEETQAARSRRRLRWKPLAAAAACLLLGQAPRAVALAALYAVISAVHSFLEPKVMAAQAGTIPYELTCAVSKRVPRVYLQNGQVTERELLLRF